MAVAERLRSYLERQAVLFEPIEHARTFEMARAAHAAHVSGRNVAKGVMVRQEDQYVLAVLPASERLDMTRLGRLLGKSAALASEAEAARRFPDCEFGAIPAAGGAYGLEMIVDDDLLEVDEIYFEGGDHQTLVSVNSAGWRRLVGDVRHGHFSADDGGEARN